MNKHKIFLILTLLQNRFQYTAWKFIEYVRTLNKRNKSWEETYS